MRRLRESVVTAFALTMSWTLVSATVVSGYQATGHENNQGQGYTGVRMTHQILSNVEGLNCLNQFI
jgi:hypothetical protein